MVLRELWTGFPVRLLETSFRAEATSVPRRAGFYKLKQREHDSLGVVYQLLPHVVLVCLLKVYARKARVERYVLTSCRQRGYFRTLARPLRFKMFVFAGVGTRLSSPALGPNLVGGRPWQDNCKVHRSN